MHEHVLLPAAIAIAKKPRLKDYNTHVFFIFQIFYTKFYSYNT